jgi:HlyD family secretion protein
VHTVSGVINPAEQLMLVVPSGNLLDVEVRVPQLPYRPIDDWTAKHVAFRRLRPAHDARGEGNGESTSPDTIRESESGQFYFAARITADQDERAGLGDRKLLRGMSVEAFVETSPRTAFSYPTKPLADQFRCTFREQ